MSRLWSSSASSTIYGMYGEGGRRSPPRGGDVPRGGPPLHPREEWRHTDGDGAVPLQLGGAAISFFLAVVSMVVGFASPYWIELRTTPADTNIETHSYRGLWRECTKVGPADQKCEETINSEEEIWYRACQAMSVLTLVSTGIVAVYFLYWAYSYSRFYFNKLMILIILGMTVLMVVSLIAVFGIKAQEDFSQHDFKWGYIVYCLSAPFLLLPFPLIVLVPSYELTPDWSGPWYRRFAGRQRPSPLRFFPPPPLPRDRGPPKYGDYAERNPRRISSPRTTYY